MLFRSYSFWCVFFEHLFLCLVVCMFMFYRGSPLFWIGVGVGLSALFTWVSTTINFFLGDILSIIVLIMEMVSFFVHILMKLSEMTGSFKLKGEGFFHMRYGCIVFACCLYD